MTDEKARRLKKERQGLSAATILGGVIGNGVAGGDGGRCNGRLAHASGTKGTLVAGHLGNDRLERAGRLVDGGQGVIHPGGGHRLAVFIINHFFVQGPATALGCATHHLALDQERVQGFAHILGHNQLMDLYRFSTSGIEGKLAFGGIIGQELRA